MAGEQAEGFADNWSYLKTELNWLDRVLMVAVARQRKDAKDLERVAQSRADRVTSHWWKGLVSLEGAIAYDEQPKPAQTGTAAKPNYQQQLDTQIRASYQRGVMLGLPYLRERLALTLFEKNLVLMSLAPEINRRYARIYRYLQGEDGTAKTDLPTVDLVLRLLCRNDQEWRMARNRLMTESPLVQYHLLTVLKRQEDTLLNYPLKLSSGLVDYLLADQPTPDALEAILQRQGRSPQPPSWLVQVNPTTPWSNLVLPSALIADLQSLSQTLQAPGQIQERWPFETCLDWPQKGQVALLVGLAGTGKTVAARAIATAAGVPLTMVDLSLVEPEQYGALLQDMGERSPAILLVKAAHHWLQRSALISMVQLNRFLAERRATPSLTLLSVARKASVQLPWQRQMDQILIFPEPSLGDRLRLWQQAVPPQIPLDPQLDWHALAQVRLTGGQIGAIVQKATLDLVASGELQLTLAHLQRALAQYKQVQWGS